MKKMKKTALAAAVLMSVMAGSAWAKTVDVTTPADLNTALLNPDCDDITIDANAVGQTYSSTHYDTAIQLNTGVVTAANAKTIQGNGYVLYDFLTRDIGWIGKDAENVLTLDNVKIYASTVKSLTLKNLVIQNGKNNDGKSFHLLTAGSYLNKSSSDCPVLYVSSGGFTVTAENVQFLNNLNTNSNGGGALSTSNNSMYSTGAKLDFRNVTFRGNLATKYGGAMQISGTDVLNLQGVFEDNHAGSHGGAVNIDLGSQVNNFGGTFIGNTSGYKIVEGKLDMTSIGDGNGGAIAVRPNPAGVASCDVMSVTMITDNSVFKGNKVANYSNSTYLTGAGGAIYNGGGVFTINKATFGGTEDGEGNEARVGGALGNSSYRNSYGTFLGKFTVSNSNFYNNIAYEMGGAIYNNNSNYPDSIDGNVALFSEFVVSGSEFKGNKATEGVGYGGAIYNKAKFEVDGSVFEGNKAVSGGAVYNDSFTPVHSYFTNMVLYFKQGTMDIKDSDFINNEASDNGGALCNLGSMTVAVDKNKVLTFQGNSANNGGAVYNGNFVFTNGRSDYMAVGTYKKPATLSISNASFTNNTATTDGGAIYNEAGCSLTLENVTFSGNTAAGKPNDIYNAGTLTLNNVKFEDVSVTTVVNAATGNITFGKDTRVSVATIDNTAGGTMAMVGGTLVTTQENRTTDDDNFTMTNGVIELTNDYKLADIDSIQKAVKEDYGQGNFSLKFTGNIIQEQGKEPEPVNLETLIEQKIELPTAPVDAKSLVTGEGEQKQLKIGGDSDKIKEDLAVGTIDVGDAKKLVIMPVDMGTDNEKEIVLEFGNSEASGPLIVTKNNEKVDVELAEGAKIVVAPKQKLEIANLDAKNNGDKHVTLAGEIAAEKFNVAAPGDPTQEIICFNVGNDEQMGSLSVGEVGMNGAMVFADPAWANDITEASAYSQGGTEINGKLVGGRNSVISVGTTDRTVAEQIFKDMKTFSFGNEGDVNAVLYVATAQTMADTGAIWINGDLKEKPTTAPEGKSFAVAAKSLTMVEAAAAGTNGAISGLTSASVDSAAKLFIANAEPNKVYTILTGENIAYGWEKDNVAVNGVIKDLQVEREDTYFKVTTGTVGFNVPGAVIPNVGDAITLDAGSKALDVLFKMVDVPSEAQKAANVNTYANLGENLGVTRGAYDVISMTGEAINQHWANKEDGESVWAVYNHSKDKVDGLKLGGMDAQYDAQYNGVTVGYDINKDFGIALNHVDGNVSNGYGGHNDAKYYGISIYGRKNFGKVNLLGDVTYSHGKNELEQNGISADAKTNTFSMGVTAKYDTNMVKVGNVTPFAGVRYVRIDGKDYTDSIGVNREADKVNSVIVPMGVEYSAEFNVSGSDWNCKPVLALGYLFNFGDKDNTMTLSYNGAKDSFGYDFVDNGAFFTKAALNFTKNNLTLGVGYDYMKSSNSNNNKWNVSLNYAF